MNFGDVVDVEKITQDLISGKGIEYNSIFGKLINVFFREVVIALKGVISILIILILIALLKNLEIEKRKFCSTNCKFCMFFKFINDNDYNFYTNSINI